MRGHPCVHHYRYFCVVITGLVRSGVAPDHPEVKSVANDFSAVVADAPSSQFRFFGGVELGKDVSLNELRDSYDAVVLAYGAQSDRSLGAAGEDLPGVLSARRFVNWYNGHPDFSSPEETARMAEMLGRSEAESVAIVGQGNVAVDCARVLVKSLDELRKTDIADHALEVLAESKVRRV